MGTLPETFAVFQEFLLLETGQAGSMHQRERLESLDFMPNVQFEARDEATQE